LINLFNRIIAKINKDGLLGLILAIILRPFTFKERIRQKEKIADLNLITEKATLKERFNLIHANNFWESKESISGNGSEIHYTEKLRNWMINVLPEYQIKRLTDAPCGDFNWMKLVVSEIEIEYQGFDIVDSLIKNNNALYRSDKVQFDIANICEDKLPDCDLLMVRDFLFHLSYSDINKFLKNIANVNYKYLLTTTHMLDKEFVNKDIKSADHRLIDLFKEPFNFDSKKVINRVDDFPIEESVAREMILICKPDVPKSIKY
jgi:hypothetical protein